MTWQDSLLPASFRGAEFLYLDTRRDGGRRQVNHEFPDRDDNDLEDLGRKAKTHRIQGFVIGNDYDTARDALEDALDEAGSGTLVHPYKGNLTVGCGSYSIQESVERGGMARFDMVFIEAGSQPSPTSSTNTATDADDAATDQFDILSTDFSALYSLDGLPGFITDALNGNVFALLDDLGVLSGLPGLPLGFLDDALGAILSAFDDPLALGGAVTAFFTTFAGSVVEILPVDDPTTSSRGAPPVTDPTYGLASFAVWGADLPQIAPTTAQRIQQAQSQAAFVSLVQGSAVAAMAQLFANTQFASAGDAESARTQLTDLIDVQATAAGDAGDDLAFGGWMKLYRASSQDLTTRAQRLPEILTYRLAASLPALTVAQRVYQDGTFAADLVARNAAPHPLFMPLQIEALAA